MRSLENDVLLAQKAWANAIKSISKTYLDGGDYVTAAGYCAGELYGYGKSALFKPTKATNNSSRPQTVPGDVLLCGSKAMNKTAISRRGRRKQGARTAATSLECRLPQYQVH